MFFHAWEKWYVQSEATEACEFRAKISAFYCSLQRRFHTFNEKSFTQRVFLAKKVKNISEMEWNSFVCFTVDKKKKSVESGRKNSGKGKTERDVSFCCVFLSELLCLSFKLKLILKPAILLKFTHFQLCIESKQLRLLIVLGLPHILTVTYVFNKMFLIMFLLKRWYFVFVVILR